MSIATPIRPDRTLMLVNPLSFRLSLPGAFARLRKQAQGLGLDPHVVYGPQEIGPLLGPALEKGLDLIIIVGGDGTLQGCVSLLAGQFSAHAPPPILMLGGGRTNYTAAHLGTQKKPILIIERALTRPDAFDKITKASLAIQQGTKPTVFGFFVGGALVDHVIRDCHQYRATGRGRFRQGKYSTLWRLLQLSLLGMFRRVHYQSQHMALFAEGVGELQGPVRLLVATTLDENQVRIHPYLPIGQGPVKLTAVLRHARRFWTVLPWLLLGKRHPRITPQNGYLSGRASSFEIKGLTSICVDGQEYDLDPTEQTRIETGPDFVFLSL